MELFTYYYSLIDKHTGEVILSNSTAIQELKAYVSEALFEYLETESKTGRLNASRLADDNIICVINKIVVSKVS
ncbi:hypothetical protein I2486_02885 [Cellulophaga sp. E16_2]|uniref:hypothetical protein n=1 Tax=Cellulophaga sp. E16_2 TaxID=2789297 RepID=UPI001A90FA96|nr:hypothetical protein [Cellulophaga sp. E16_2]MBO0590341.1 hypothetical protein [Cellulophaga sp. E16_2]